MKANETSSSAERDNKPAGRLATAQDVRAAIAAMLERLRELQRRRAPALEAGAEKAWPEDLNAAAAPTTPSWGRDQNGEVDRG